MPVAIKFTEATQTLLDSMPESVREFLERYIDNPIFEKALYQGLSQKLWLNADKFHRFELDLDAKGTLDIAFYKENNVRQTHYAEEHELFKHWPTRRAQPSNLERTHYVIARLADSINMARNSNKPQQKGAIKELANQLPWFRLAYDVSKSIVPAEHETPFEAFIATLSKWKILDETSSSAFLSPRNAVFSLTAVYASGHSHAEPRLYALEKEGEPPSFLFVKPKDAVAPEDTSIPEELIMWFDSNGVLTFIAEQSRTCICAYMADMRVHPDPTLRKLEWFPEENTFKGKTWDEALQKSTQDAQPLLHQLAHRTVRPMTALEAIRMVEQWLTRSPTFLDMWEDNEIMLVDHQQAVNLEKRIGISLFAWSLWAKDLWSQAYPKQYSVLENLLDEMVSPSTMRTWFEHMHRVSNTNVQESFNVEQLLDPSP